MTRILFICLGNICRSPMAEFVMKDLVEKAGIAEKFEIASAATSAEEVGNPVYPPARQKLADHAISCVGKTARQMTRQDYDTYDYLVAMDRSNLRDMARFVGNDPLHKVSLLMSYTSTPHDVADPWFKFRGHMAGCTGRLHGVVREAVPIKETTGCIIVQMKHPAVFDLIFWPAVVAAEGVWLFTSEVVGKSTLDAGLHQMVRGVGIG